MFIRKVSKIVKRDGRLVNFDKGKIIAAISKAAIAVHENPVIANKLIDKIERLLFLKYRGRLPTVENIQDVIETVLIQSSYKNIAKVYILYREKRNEVRAAKKFYGIKIDELKLSVNAIKVLQSRYLLKNRGIIENPINMFERVARAVSLSNRKYGEDPKRAEKIFFESMSRLEFLPNSPCLMNAGTRFQMLSACFVLPIEDSLDKIFDSLKTAAMLQKYGGGTGFSFSNLRQKEAIIESTKGVTSGPVSFMGLFDCMTNVIKQGSRRRGANMGILRVDHPDILDFISCKNSGDFNNFNISVAVTDKFMDAVIKDQKYDLIDPRTKVKLKKLSAKSVFDLMVINAWENGDPGLVFIDRINKLHPLYNEIESTNPCGEQPLLPNESCVLGSINLAKFAKNKKIDWNGIKKTVYVGVHFLDNIIDVNDYVTKDIEDITKLNRKIGLGIMGFADMLFQLEISYGSEESFKLADKLMHFISSNAREASRKLGRKRGNFPNFENSKLKKHYKNMRNATVTTIAPTGSLSIITSSSSGIEPVFALSYVREILEGTFLIEDNPYFEKIAKEKGFYTKDLIDEISRSGSLKDLRHVPLEVKKIFVTALDIKPEIHVKMQATFQKYVDNAVSKTINLPENATREDVKKAYLLAYKLGCKGITVFRAGSKEGGQVLYSGNEKRVRLHSEFAGGCPDLDCGH